MIVFFNEDIAFHLENSRKIKNWISTIIKKYNRKVGDINFIFCSDQYLLQINNKYLNHNYFTDIITFNYNDDSFISSDIYISIETVKLNATEYKVSFENELKRVMIHGILHLLEFDDKTEAQKIEIRQKEDDALNIFNPE